MSLLLGIFPSPSIQGSELARDLLKSTGTPRATIVTTESAITVEQQRIITTQGQLSVMTDGDYILGNNIELSNWQPIDFSGTLEGNGYTLTLDGEPLFNHLNGKVQNLLLEGSVTASKNVGALAYSMSGGLIQNCWSGAAVAATGFMPDGVAGFVGNMTGGKVEGSLVTGTLTKPRFGKIYGIAVRGNGATFRDCFWTADTKEVSLRTEGQGCEKITELDYDSIMTILQDRVGTTKGLRQWLKDRDGIPKPIGEVSDGSLVLKTDKTKLKELLDEAQIAIDHQEKYLLSRWQVFENKFNEAQAVYNNPSVRQSVIDDVTEVLQIAITQLITKSNYNQLEEKMTKVRALDYEEYTPESWRAVSTALSEANNILWQADTINNSQGITNDDIVNAYEKLSQALAALVEIEWISIHTSKELESIQDDKNYKLAADLVDFKGNPYPFNGRLDGNGHTVTFAEHAKPLFHTIDHKGQVRNIGLVGTVNGGGAFAEVLNGKIINSYAWANVSNGNNPAGGVAGKLDQNAEATLENTYVTGTIEGSLVGGLIGEASERSYLLGSNSYWVNGEKAIGNDEEENFRFGEQKSLEAMQDKAFCTNLNNRRKSTGTQWNRNEQGLPYFGEELAPQEKGYPVVMTDLVDGSKQTIVYKDATFTTDIFGEPSGYVAQLNLEGYEGKVYWQTVSDETNRPILIAATSGKVFVRGPGMVKVTAHKDWAEGELLQSFYIKTEVPEQFDLMLKVGDKDYTNGNYTTDGSQSFGILPYISVGDEGVYTQVSTGLFNWQSDAPHVINVGTDGWVGIKEVGTVTLKVTLGNVSRTLRVTSTYIAVENIQSRFEGTYIIHGRNPNSIGQNGTPGIASFNPLRNVDEHGEVIVGSELHLAQVSPRNATYADQYTVTSSNKSVLDYRGQLQNCLLPFKAGKTTLTVTSNDPKLEKKVSDTADVTLKYLNPLIALTVKETKLTVKTGETIDAGLIFEGENAAPSMRYPEGLHVTESNMIWHQTSTDGGQVSAYRSYPVIMIGDQNAFKNEGTVSNDQWLIRGVKPGTVTLVGTPVDETYPVAPITLHITVTKGEQEEKPATEQVSQQLHKTASYHLQQMKHPTFNSEWGILAFARLGYAVPQDFYETYYASVYSKVAEEANKSKERWDNKVTETQRLALALTAMGKDPRHVNGINLLDYTWNKQAHFPNAYDIGALGDRQGSNELIFGLLAVEAHHSFTQPKDASMTVEAMVDKLLEKFQLAEGGFGLYDNQTLSIDLTAMAIQALAKHQDKPYVQEAIDKALAKLSMMQSIDGSYGNAESTSQVILALTEIGIDPHQDARFIKDGLSVLDGLMLYANEDGSFSHTIVSGANPMATEQALYTLVALNRFYENKLSLYRMDDVSFGNESTDTRVTGVKLIATDTTLSIGEKTTLKAQVLPAQAKNQKVTWKSSKPDVATITQEGVVTGIAKGKTTIQVVTEEGHYIDEVIIEVSTFDTKGYVTLSVDKQAIDKGYVLAPTQVEMKDGDTVWDVLKRTLDASNIPYSYSYHQQYGSVYVESIDGDGEFDHGPGSGWKYNVDGVYPDYGASQYKLQGGERIAWRYTTNLGADLEEAPLLPDQEQEEVTTLAPEIEADKNGNAYVIISDEAIITALQQAQEAKNDTISIKPIIKGESHIVCIELESNSINHMAKAQKNLKIQTETSNLTLELSGLKQLARHKNKKVMIVFNQLASQVIQFEVQVDGKTLSTIDGGMKVEIIAKDTYNKVLVQQEKDEEKVLKKTVITKDGLGIRLEGSSTLQVVTYQNTFDDLETNHWAHEAIAFVSVRELFKGTQPNYFSPHAGMTRGMLVTVLHRIEDERATEPTKQFVDVEEGKWYTNAVYWATKSGIVVGYENQYAPHADLTREQLVQILYSYAKYLGLDTTKEGSLEVFVDQEDTSPWAKEALSWAVGTGLIKGKQQHKLAPKDAVTRAEVAKILMELMMQISY